ncbi:LacI family DNA-binding transcriptional regulator [Bifidobacterium felsineum]|nr:LacI family DNA-binding transcriptional regulator [Bifidobacterium felsineum]
MMVTITDVARVAGVSKNTVSRYLNNRGYISEQTRNNIQKTIDLLHYQPNQIARSLYSQKTQLIGFVIPEIAHPFFSTMTSYIEDELNRRGYKMILCSTMHSEEKEKECIDLLMANKVDGMIIGSHSLDINYAGIGSPVVALDRYLASSIPVVSADHVQGGMIAARAVIEHGCTNVAQFIGYSKVRSPSFERYRVFAEQMHKHGIRCVSFELGLNQFEMEPYLRIADKFLTDNQDVDGIFASDLIALAIQKRALEMGRKIPEDLFLFGYDGSYVYKFASPSLPTVIQPYAKIAERAVDVLIRKIEGEEIGQMEYTVPVTAYLPEREQLSAQAQESVSDDTSTIFHEVALGI